MSMAKRKFMSEFGVSLNSNRWLMVSAGELASDGDMSVEASNIARACHIYLICRRPTLSFSPKISFDGNGIKGELVYRIAGTPTVKPFFLPFKLEDAAIGVRVTPYPHRKIESYTKNDEVVRFIPAELLVFAGIVEDKRLLNHEVLYVGQAYAKGRRSALDRLKSHSTLQKILAVMQTNYPDDEAIILTFEYNQYRAFISFDGNDTEAIRDNRDTSRIQNILKSPLTTHQQICLAEAGLIRYFKPKYNEIYKDSFPASDQKILHDCYKLDFSALIVEINTEELRVRLYSDSVSPSEHHIAKFTLINEEARRSFFTFLDRDGTSFSILGVIPRTR